MPNTAVNFLGSTLVIPGVYEQDNVSGVPLNNARAGQTLIFVGYGYGQKQYIPATYSSIADLQAGVRGGPAADFIPFLTNPSGQLNGAQTITFINASLGTQSTGLLKKADATNLGTITSANYGVPSNLLQVQVSTGTVAGKKITLYDGFANTQVTQDNLGVPFQLAYTGAATSGLSFTVTTSGLTATSIAVTSPTTGESYTFNIGLSQFSTIKDVVNGINGTGFWSAQVLGDGSLPALYLDTASSVALTPPSGGVPQYSNITASLGSVVYWFNQFAAQNYATFAVTGTITSYTSGLVPGNIPLTPLSGATSAAPDASTYAAALNAALNVPGWSVFVDSNTAAVQSLLAQHCITASSPQNAMYRRGFTGSVLGDSVATTQANARALNAKEVTYCYPGIFRTDTRTNINTEYSGLFAAAAAAGISCGTPFATSFTNKSVTSNGVETRLSLSQMAQLQDSGVMPVAINPNTNVVTFVQDITTWQNDSNPENVHAQQVQCRFALANLLIGGLQQYIGAIAAPITLAQVRTTVVSILNSAIWTATNNGILADWDSKSLSLVYTAANQTLAITVNVLLVGQINFINIVVPILPLNLQG